MHFIRMYSHFYIILYFYQYSLCQTNKQIKYILSEKIVLLFMIFTNRRSNTIIKYNHCLEMKKCKYEMICKRSEWVFIFIFFFSYFIRVFVRERDFEPLHCERLHWIKHGWFLGKDVRIVFNIYCLNAKTWFFLNVRGYLKPPRHPCERLWLRVKNTYLIP